MMQVALENSGSSRDGDDELVILQIKPPQTSSEVDSTLHHKNVKKKKHSKESKGNRKHRRHHHNHKYGHLKTSNADFSDRNQDMESKPFHYRNNKVKNQDREFEKNFVDKDIDMISVRSKKITKEVIQSDRDKNIQCDEITDVRHIKLVKNIRESRRYNNRNEERSTYFLEKMKQEWRNKRLQWLQHQKNKDPRLWAEKEDFQGNNYEKEANKHYKNMPVENFRNENNTTDQLQIVDEKHTVIALASSEEESMDYDENSKSDEFADVKTENIICQENTAAILDINNSDNNAESTSADGSVEVLSTSESEKVGSHENLFEETIKETEAASTLKKENPVTKSNEENEISSASGEKCPLLEATKLHTPKLPVYCPAIQGCRSIDGFQFLNRIEEGTYGVVYRARDKETKEIVALKRLKMEREKEGFPITSLREINTLLKAQHPNIVTVREIVVGSNMDRIYIVMDYVEHDLKSLMKTMPRPFLIGEVKTLLMQLLCAVAHLHDNWILHRDLKTSNLLLSHQGILKVGDFGLAREYGSPLKSYTPVVVTLWYRAPELLLGTKKYSTSIDMWSVGCIFGELLTKNALFPGKSESDQINRIFKDLGTPSENIWPGYSELPLVQSINITQYPYNNLKNRFSPTFTDVGFDLLNRFLTYNPARRISAEKAKSHEYFTEKPKPIPPNMFPTWPAKSEQEYRTARSSPKPPLGGINYSRH